MAPLLSIIVPFYGVQDYLADCLDSLRAQTLTDFEVIAVDDGSPDGSLAIAERYAAADPRFRVLRQPNQGPGPARDTGARVATGRYLAFVDGDDLVPPGAYELMVSTLERTGSSFVAGNANRMSPDGVVYPSWTHKEAFATDVLQTSVRTMPILIRDRMIWNKVYRRDFWVRGGYRFPAIRYEDYPVSMAVHLDADRVDVLSAPVYIWRDRPAGNSITQKVFESDNLHDRVTSARMVLDLLVDRGTPELVRLAKQYLVDVDLLAVAGGLVHATPATVGQIGDLGAELATLLVVPGGTSGSNLAATLVCDGFAARDWALVRAAVRYRDGAGPAGMWAELRRDFTVGRLVHVGVVAARFGLRRLRARWRVSA